MVDVLMFGFVESIRCNDNFVVMKVSVRRNGYKKKDGTVVGSEVYVYRVLFMSYMRKYISEHFASGVLVKIKGTLLPFSRNGAGEVVDGYTIFGQTCERGSYPSWTARLGQKMVKESMDSDVGVPDVDSFLADDF